MSAPDSEDIAIVGMAGLFPRAPDIDAYWRNILNKVDAVTQAPDGWIGDERILDPESSDINRIYMRRGGFLADLATFDPKEFGTMPFSVEGGQPDQFLAMKLARDALTDAGYAPGTFDGRSTGVILGHSVHIHRANVNGVHHVWFLEQTRSLLSGLFPGADDDRLDAVIAMFRDRLPRITSDAVPGLVPNIMTGRIANRFDLMGPNYIIDAACASTLIAVDQAISELRTGRADMMLAGGVNTTTSPLVYAVFCSVGALSHNEQIRPFDKTADGTILGEGAGTVVLKRLSDAIADEDRVYAIIKGVGQSSDGKGSGLMAPRLEGEILAIERAYRQTGIDPASIGLVEAHGTGIPLGDRTELQALMRTFGGRRLNYPDVPIGSVKSMIGHCIPAAGSASIIKCALALHNKTVPPSLCDEVSDEIAISETPFYVATEARPWVHCGPDPRRAAINAFGFGGVNAHLILEEAPDSAGPRDATAAFSMAVAPPGRVAGLAARDRAGLLDEIGKLLGDISANPAADVNALAARSWDRLGEGPQRLAIVATSLSDLEQKLGKAKTRLADNGVNRFSTRSGIHFGGEPVSGKIAFLFPGEMAQYPGMLRDAALAFPQVREWFDFLDGMFCGERAERHSHLVFPPSSGLDGETREALTGKLRQVDFGSEAVFAADQAMLAVMSRLGIEPDCMIGHSTGENAAIIASGAVDMPRHDVGEMIKRMNGVFARIEDSGEIPRGVLLNVAALQPDRLQDVLERHPDVHFTMDNCPNQAIVFGLGEAIDPLEKELIAEGAIVTRLPISWGYHTEFVRPMAASFGDLFRDAPFRPTPVTLYSCATAAPFPVKDMEEFRDTALTQYVSRVRFTDAILRMYEDGCRIFIEVGPNSILTSFVRDILGDRPHVAEASDNQKRGTLAQLNQLVAKLFVAGVTLDARALMAEQTGREKPASAAPHLPSELPFIGLTPEEGLKVRAMLDPGGSTSPSEMIVPAAPPVAHPGSRAIEASATIAGHFALMDEFLRQQERMTHAAFARGQGANGAGGLNFTELTPLFDAPFELSAVLLSGEADLDAWRDHLSSDELGSAVQLADQNNGKRLKEWLLGRLAVKRAVRGILADRSGTQIADADIAILNDQSGKPHVHLSGEAGPEPGISLSHVEGLAVGVACSPDWSVGIDIGRADRIRQPEDFLSSILSPGESELLGSGSPQTVRDRAILAWCVKEAAAKALGTGLKGRPADFRISALCPANAQAKVIVNGRDVDVQIQQLGETTCALAYCRAAP